jgi:hypothetical protein
MEQPRDGPFEETSGGGRTKRVRATESKRRHSVEPVLIRLFGRVGAVPNSINPPMDLWLPPTFLVVEEAWVNGRMLARGCAAYLSQSPKPCSGLGSPGRFLDAHCLALTGFREAAGLMLRGAPALTAGSGSDGLKYTWQPGESWSCLRTMQAVTRSTSGMSAPQRRNASSLQAACCSGV